MELLSALRKIDRIGFGTDEHNSSAKTKQGSKEYAKNENEVLFFSDYRIIKRRLISVRTRGVRNIFAKLFPSPPSSFPPRRDCKFDKFFAWIVRDPWSTHRFSLDFPTWERENKWIAYIFLSRSRRYQKLLNRGKKKERKKKREEKREFESGELLEYFFSIIARGNSLILKEKKNK